jgi:hypothetical protein
MATTLPRSAGAKRLTSIERLELMSAEERLRAYRSGAMTRAERATWAANFPEEVPLINDEYPWIACNAE